ncbi:PAS domain-containing protein [Parabacteroides sp. 52]|uniref:sensor histidine kinase n=1 Tax=unclassified Parabacteroides TaxID=2649774 RepID=UPI0013D60693|nr:MULTISPECIES: ATP-binding protein [unclassified Parabacteroides]MDH6535484.1 nitrogen fixation/metabolism regulation signal transduction histidine kinase [Parabacteroides sp. PM5-20]NDV55936.1 PAS domain-containing protein [Parabacteroides sp. 52]
MKLKRLFGILTVLLLTTMALLTYQAFYASSIYQFFIVEGLVLLTVIYLIVFYRRIVKPLYIIGNGMELLREQDFSSRLGRVGQTEADKVVDVFNKMMEQLKNERLHLREQNHFLDLLINASPLGVIILDLERKIQSVNAAASQMIGIHCMEEFVGKEFTEIDSPLTAELIHIPLHEAPTIRLNNAHIYKCTHSSFVDKGFHHSFFLIESLTQEVFKIEKKAYEKVIRMIAHEVNNTTAGITSTLDTLENAFREVENMEDVCEVLQASIERCYRMSHFITNFADVVRIPEPEIRQYALNSVVISCKRFMETICRNRDIHILMELSETSPVVSIDNSLFEQVLVNIIKNAAEAIENKGEIYIRTTQYPACLEIADTGKGIKKETEAKLFTPFFSTKPNGQGIGLILIREILQKHHCTFSLRSYPDGLTRFKIFFHETPLKESFI